jgi:hypothetical protein
MTMFNDCGFSLGTDYKNRLKMIKHFRTLTKQQLSFVLHGILDKLDNSSSDIDLSTEILSLGNLIAP